MSDELYEGSFFDFFITIYDPRQEEKVKHKLIDVLFIVVTATICNCNEWLEIEIWAREREEWLRKYLELPIPDQSNAGDISSTYCLPHILKCCNGIF